MSTRKKRHSENGSRGWEQINVVGDDGLMESEVWYIALTTLPDTTQVKEQLTEYFGSLRRARVAFESFDDKVTEKFKDLAACLKDER